MEDNMKPFRVIVVGAGATGSMVSCFLKRTYRERVALEVWDKGRGAGGRMSTTRFDKDSPLSFDLGAQYISASEEYQTKHGSLYKELCGGILSPLTASIDGMRNKDGTSHFVTPSGVSSIPKYFLQQSDAPLKSNMHLSGVDVDNLLLKVRGFDNNIRDGTNNSVIQDADAVVITIPIPQLLNLKGGIKNYLKPYQQKLKDVRYSSRYALGLFYPSETEINGVEWASKYIRDNPCLCFVSIDTKKREKDSAEGMSIVAHASVPFSIQHLEENFADVEPIMLNYLQQEIPNLPKPARTKIIRWRYSQVTNSYDGKPGHIVLNHSPLIICAGDAFTQSNFDGCVDSALSVVDCFREHFSAM